MTTLTSQQIADAAHAARERILQSIDMYVNPAIQGLGVSPGDISTVQYTEIVDAIFGE